MPPGKYLITILFIISLPLGSLCQSSITSNQDTTNKEALSEELNKFYFLATDSYNRNPDSCLFYTIRYLDLARELGDSLLIGDALYWTSDIYFYYDLDSALRYGEEYLEIAKELNDTSGIGWSYYIKGDIYRELGQIDLAIENMVSSINYFTNIGDSASVAALYNNMGYALTSGSAQVEGLTYFLKALEISEEINDSTQIANVSTNLSYFFAITDDLDNAFKYTKRSLINTITAGDSLPSAVAYAEMADIYMALDKPEEARPYIDTSMSLEPAILSPYDKASLYCTYAELFLELGQTEKAEVYLSEVKSILSISNFPLLEAYYYRQIGIQNFLFKDYDQALRNLRKSIILHKGMNTDEALVELYSYMAKTYGGMKDFERAFIYSNRSDSTKKSFNYGKVSQLLAEREKEIELNRQIEQDRIISELESMEMKNKFNTVLIVSILLIISFGIAFYFAFRLKKKNFLLERLNEENQMQQAKLKETLTELNENEQQLTALNATKDRFFSIIAHDLKNPFSNIIGLSGIYLRDKEHNMVADLDQIMEGMNSSANAGFALLENLLEWARSQTGQIIPKTQKISLDDTISKLINDFSAIDSAKNITIKFEQDKHKMVLADENMLKTVLRNIIHNAIKYSHHNGTIKIYIDSKDKYLVTTIEDSGVGISADDLSLLFAIDSGIRKPGTDDEKGSGLGLVLCKEFVEKNGGKIWAESIEGKGSKFMFSLPVFEEPGA